MAKRNSRVEDAEVDEEIADIDNTSNDDGVKEVTATHAAKKLRKTPRVDGDDAGAQGTSDEDGAKEVTANAKMKPKKDR